MALSAGVGVRTLVSANAETRCDLEGQIARRVNRSRWMVHSCRRSRNKRKK